MNDWFENDGLRLSKFLSQPSHTPDSGVPAVIVCHGFPVGAIGAAQSAHSFPELAERITHELGWTAMCFNLRGCGRSDGNFSLDGWQSDVAAAVTHLRANANISQLFLAGFSTGASLAIDYAARDRRVAGVAAMCARADIEDWASQPRRFLQHARDIGVIRDPSEPKDFDKWSKAFQLIQPVRSAKQMANRPLLLVHGSDDDVVPVDDSRRLAQSHGRADLHIVSGAGHRLRHDPRALAILFGWLDQQHQPEMPT